jgi:hypothetical protein
MITKIANGITLKDDFLQIRFIFGKKSRFSISELDKIYIKPVKKPMSRFTIYFVLVVLINLFSYVFLVLNIAYGILVLSVIHMLYQIKYMKTSELCFEFNNKIVNKVQIPTFLKNETIDTIRIVKMRINAKSSS